MFFQAWLHQAMGDVHLRVDLLNFQLLLSYELLDMVKLHLNVFHLRIVEWVLNEVCCAL